MSLVSIGPFSTFHGDPEFSFSSVPTSRSGRKATISGLTDWEEAMGLSEFVGNPDEQVTIGDTTGVLDQVTFDDDLLGPFSGWWVLESFEIRPDHRASVGFPVSFSLSGSFLGDAP